MKALLAQTVNEYMHTAWKDLGPLDGDVSMAWKVEEGSVPPTALGAMIELLSNPQINDQKLALLIDEMQRKAQDKRTVSYSCFVKVMKVLEIQHTDHHQDQIHLSDTTFILSENCYSC